MSDDNLYDLLSEHGPEYLVGRAIDLAPEFTVYIASIIAVGNSMIVYDLPVLNSSARFALKVPRARPGTPEHDRVLSGYRLATELLANEPEARRYLAFTKEIELNGVPCFIQVSG